MTKEQARENLDIAARVVNRLKEEREILIDATRKCAIATKRLQTQSTSQQIALALVERQIKEAHDSEHVAEQVLLVMDETAPGDAAR